MTMAIRKVKNGKANKKSAKNLGMEIMADPEMRIRQAKIMELPR